MLRDVIIDAKSSPSYNRRAWSPNRASVQIAHLAAFANRANGPQSSVRISKMRRRPGRQRDQIFFGCAHVGQTVSYVWSISADRSRGEYPIQAWAEGRRISHPRGNPAQCIPQTQLPHVQKGKAAHCTARGESYIVQMLKRNRKFIGSRALTIFRPANWCFLDVS